MPLYLGVKLALMLGPAAVGARFADPLIGSTLQAVVAAVLHDLAAALKSSAPDFSSRLFRVLPPAAAALLGSTIDAMGPATLDDITEARREICQVARILESRGELVRPLRRE